MPRPKKNRRTNCDPTAVYFKPRGIPIKELQECVLEEDELEAFKLADYEDCSHEDGAKEMDISRATFGRILKSARKKVIEAILEGKAIKIRRSF